MSQRATPKEAEIDEKIEAWLDAEQEPPAWIGNFEERDSSIILDGRFTIKQLEALLAILKS